MTPSNDHGGETESGFGIEIDTPSHLDLIKEFVCSFRQHLGIAIAFATSLLALSLFSLVYLEPGKLGYTVAIIDTVALSLFLVVTVYLFTRCRP